VLHFIKYNNLTVFILLGVFLLSTGVFAQTETGQTIIGAQQTSIEGIDNTLLLEVDLDSLDMDFKIEKIEKDDKYYYVTYTFINLEKQDQTWQYQFQQKVRKVSLKLRQDLGEYLAEELVEEYEARIKELRVAQVAAQIEGETVRTEVVEYDGLIGKTLEIAGNIFPGYEPVKRSELPSPSVPEILTLARELALENGEDYENYVDDLLDIYDEYISENDPDQDDVFGIIDNCPNDYNPDQLDIDEDGMGNICDPNPDSYDAIDIVEPEEESATTTPETATTTPEVTDEPATTTPEVIEEPEVEIIELPVEEPEIPTEPEPVE